MRLRWLAWLARRFRSLRRTFRHRLRCLRLFRLRFPRLWLSLRRRHRRIVLLWRLPRLRRLQRQHLSPFLHLVLRLRPHRWLRRPLLRRRLSLRFLLRLRPRRRLLRLLP